MRIPEGCQNEQVVRVKWLRHAAASGANRRGDMYVHVNVVVPKKVTKKQRELLERFAEEMGEEVEEPRGAWQKLKDIFEQHMAPAQPSSWKARCSPPRPTRCSPCAWAPTTCTMRGCCAWRWAST